MTIYEWFSDEEWQEADRWRNEQRIARAVGKDNLATEEEETKMKQYLVYYDSSVCGPGQALIDARSVREAWEKAKQKYEKVYQVVSCG